MNMFLRVILLKVLVLLSLGSTAAWAECPDHDKQALNGQFGHSELMIAATESEGSADDDDSMNDEEDDSAT